MKVFLMILLALVMTPASLRAQRFHGGLLGGFTATQVDGDSYAGYNKSGFQGGVFVYTLLGRKIGAQLEIKYIGKGAKKPVTSLDPSVYTLTLHYIELPVMFTYPFKNIFKVNLGLAPAYLFGDQGEDNGGKLPADFLVTFRKFDLSSQVGLTFKLPRRFSVDFRFSYSIFSIRNLDLPDRYYSWYGRLLGYRYGTFNNCLSAAVLYEIR